MTLEELRTAFTQLTQAQLGARLGTSQAAVHGFESRSDVRVSRLMAYVEAMNGELEITAKFRTGHKVRLRQFLSSRESDRNTRGGSPKAETDDEAWHRKVRETLGEYNGERR